MHIAGLDIGTTGCKVTIYDEHGEYCFKAYRNYPVSRKTGEHEVNAADIWRSVQEVMREAAGKYPQIKGIGITSFGETFVLTDEQGSPLALSMLYTDPRGEEQCERLVGKLGNRKIASITGVKPHTMYSLPKIMWVKDREPDIYQKAAHIFLMEDFIVYLLTGNAQIDYSLAARTMAFDIKVLDWSDEILEAAGVKKDLLSRPVPSGTIAGTLRKEMADRLGLKEDTLIVSVGHDQVAAAIGAAVFKENLAVDGAGTVECITPVFEGIPESPVFYEGSYAIVPYVIPGKYVCYAFSFTGGALIQWFIENQARYEKRIAEEQGISVYSVLEQNMLDKPTGILVLPHFAGAGTPYMDPDSKGAILGLTLSHNTSDLYRAMMEGVTYEMRLNMELLEQSGIKFHMFRATGGGAASKVWMQMKADILNVPIVSLGSSEAGAAGSAMLTGVSVGSFQNLEEAASRVVKELDTYYPRREQHEAYNKYYTKYKEIYKAVRPLVSEEEIV